jgi:hypothetical protein
VGRRAIVATSVASFSHPGDSLLDIPRLGVPTPGRAWPER